MAKKIIISILLIILIYFIGLLVFDKKQDNKETIKSGWYVEITNSYINVRNKPDQYSNRLDEVKKGEIYRVKEVNLDDKNYYWYNIEIDKYKTGWIASSRSTPYLKDYNNPNDIATPVLKFQDEAYYVNSINDINYNHLELWDDKPNYKITHKIYHEYNELEKIDQYWIVYRIEDKSGKYSEKTQKIIFTILPDEKDVLNFNDYK